jgi:ATP-dependent RNA helicase DHX8/PRP22
MDDLESLELLSLVSKVTSELQNHLGISDKTLAEFVIAQHLQCKSLDEFKKKLDAMGADFPQSLIESIDRLVLTMHPKMKWRKENAEQRADQGRNKIDEKTRVFKGLALPDREIPWEDEDEVVEEKSNGYKNGGEMDAIDDTLALLENLEGEAGREKLSNPSRKRSRSPDEESYDRRRGRGRKERRRSPSSDYDEPRHRKENYDEDGYGRSRNGHKSSRRKPDDDDYFRRPPEPEIDDEPILYKVYEGHVTGVKDFGAFVNLHRVKGKVDGLVHVSALLEGQRINHPSDLVSR